MRILIITTVKDEGPYLLEWIAHHRAAGATDFLVFSNDCEDGTHQILKTLQRAGIIRHIEQTHESGKSVQWQALKTAWKHPLFQKADWVLVSDIDEFVNIKTGNHTFQDLIAAVSPEADGIMLKWRLFGHNGVVDLQDIAVTEQFTKAIPSDACYPIAASLFKTLFKPSGPFRMLGVHRPQQKELSKARRPIFVDGSGRFLEEGFARNEKRISLYGQNPGTSLVELNHYAVKSAAAFLIKRGRGLPNRKKPIDLAYWVERNFNIEDDRSIYAMRPATQEVLDKLLSLPGLKKLHDSSVDWHRAKFDALISDPENQALMTKLLIAGGSELVADQLQRRLIAWYHAAHEKTGDNP